MNDETSLNSSHSLGPLEDDMVVAIVGGGPSGSGCAIALLKLAKQKGVNVKVIIFEGKVFKKSQHYNQCAGVLSPPLDKILTDDLKLDFPYDMTQKVIDGYILHGLENSIVLNGDHAPSHAVRRVNFDEYLLHTAENRGAELVQARVTDIEIQTDGVRIYAENGNYKADVVVGAFGLDDGTGKLFERDTPYQQPRFLNAIVTKIHPDEEFMNNFGFNIHAFLPIAKEIEFGAVTPKLNHLTINIAGSEVNTIQMDKFLNLSEVREVLPPSDTWDSNELNYYKGRFPIGLAKGYYGDRYVILGDAAGMVRPFKGKGINSGILTGIRAATVMLENGISRKAFKHYVRMCSKLTNDMPYGKVLRFLTLRLAKMKMMDPVIELAGKRRDVAKMLFDCVSANDSIKNVYIHMLKHNTIPSISFHLFKRFFVKNKEENTFADT